MNKRIAIINSIFPYGSTGRISLDLLLSLKSSGYEAKCFHGRGLRTSENNVNFSNQISIYADALFSRLDDRAGFHSNLNTKKLIQLLEIYNPSLYVIHNIHGYYLNMDILFHYLANSNKPIIFVFHDCWNITGHCAHFAFVGCEKWKSLCNECPQTKSYPKSFLVDNSSNNQRRKEYLFSLLKKKIIITPSRWLNEIVKDSFLRDSNIITVNNGIDLDIFYPKKIDKTIITPTKSILAVAGVWTKKKGINDILKLSSIIKPDEKIIVVGKLAEKIRFPDNVVHISHTNNVEELVGIYSSSDVLFNPTYEDTYPNVNMESIACGCPVVCYKTGGAHEMLDPNFVVSQGDVYAAYEIIEKIFENKVRYDFSRRDSFSNKLMHKKYIEIINKMLAN